MYKALYLKGQFSKILNREPQDGLYQTFSRTLKKKKKDTNDPSIVSVERTKFINYYLTLSHLIFQIPRNY